MTLRLNAWSTSAMLLITLIALTLLYFPACGVQKRTIVEQQPPPPPPPADDSGGDEDDGGDDGEPPPPPPACDFVAFDEIQQILTDRCVSCHFAPERIDTYALADSWSDEIVRRINLSNGNDDRMPPSPAPALLPAQRDLIEKWVEGGKQKACANQPPKQGFIDLRSAEQAMLTDALKLDAADRINTRYLVTADLINEGKEAAELSVAQQAMDKGLNSLNVIDDNLFRATKISPGVWRIDLEDFGIQGAKIAAVEAAEPLKIISQTDEGVQLRGLIGSDKPWFHMRNFIDTTHRNADVYYIMTDVPATLALYQAQLGIDVNAELADFNASFLGSADSPISIEKNRLITRFDLDNNGGADGYYWQTFDPIALGGDATKNLFEFPFLLGTGGSKIFNFAASEVIVTGRNGMQFYSLWAADGTRQNAAPLNVVADNKPGPRGPEIVNAISCQKCHYAGIITMRDQIREHVIANAQTFTAADVQIVKELYRAANSNTATFTKDIRQYGLTLNELGIDTTKPDPINVVNDEYLSAWTAKKVASLLFLQEDEFLLLLRQSAIGSAQLGQLLSPGGQVTFDQIVQTLPQLIVDLRLFQEPLGE